MPDATWSWADVRAGLADAIRRNVKDLRAVDEIKDDPNPPVAIIAPKGIDYWKTFGPGASEIEFSIVLLVAGGTSHVSQTALDRYLDPTGPYSIFAAILDDPTLGGVACDAGIDVLDKGSYGQVVWGANTYWGCTFSGRVEVAQGRT